MAYSVANILHNLIKDKDNALVASDLEEYYIDQGALFNVIGCTAISLSTAADMTSKRQLEFCVSTQTNLRVFHETVSTLSNSFMATAYELPGRFSTAIPSTQKAVASVLQPNRINPRTPTFDVVNLTTDSPFWITRFTSAATYNTSDLVRHEGLVYQATSAHVTVEFISTGWSTYGAVVDIQQFILEAKGGPQASDAGGITGRASFVELNTKANNYVLELHNTDTAARTYGLQAAVGAIDMLP